MSDHRINPCICGTNKRPIIEDYNLYMNWRVECPDCHQRIHDEGWTFHGSIKAWNKANPIVKTKPTAAKRKRQKIYQKYNGHCAYCGKEIEYKDMQVDHIWPKSGGGGNELENLNPACRACNFYKSAMTLEQFRDQLGLMIGRLRKDFSFRLTESYGLIRCFPKKVKFYFETTKANQ